MKIGLLPLYIALYDEFCPGMRPRVEKFYADTAALLESKGAEVLRVPVCRLENEFASAVSFFEKNGADAIVTLHLAYSPSLESARVLSATALPLVVLDTTPTFEFDFDTDPDEISYNHGIHGVMDMCNLLRRNHKKYAVVTGPFGEPVIDECLSCVRAAVGALSLKGTRTGAIGGSFRGMGDFFITDKELLDRFGVTKVQADDAHLRALAASIPASEVERELAEEKSLGVTLGDVDEEVWKNAVRDCLAVRKWYREENLSAYTMNFGDIDAEKNFRSMPFREACKAMAAGIGYAGEGDVLTASIVGALIRAFGSASFVEIFCPDWKNNKVLISHMGEMNASLIDGKVEFRQSVFNYGAPLDSVVGYGAYKSGKAVFINVFSDGEKYNLYMEPVEMLRSVGDTYAGNIRGWMRAKKYSTAAFLKKISTLGATHHSALVYGVSTDAIRFFGETLGLTVLD